MTLEVWLAFVVLETVLCLTPGPAVLYVVSTALTGGARAGFGGALGIVACNGVYFVLSALGVAAVIVASGRVFTALTWIGAAYLVWLGVRMVWRAARAKPAEARVPAAAASLSGAFVRGLGVQAANPKAIAFFVALLPQFVDPRSGVALQVAILAVTSMTIELAVQLGYVWLATRARGWSSGSWPRVLEGCSGALLIAAGARLALVRSP